MARDTPQSAILLKAVQREQKESSGFWALHGRGGGEVDRTGSFRARLVMEGLGVPYHLTGVGVRLSPLLSDGRAQRKTFAIQPYCDDPLPTASAPRIRRPTGSWSLMQY